MTSEHTLCRICQKPYNVHPLGTKNDYALESCKHCGSVTANPFPTLEQINALYEEIQPQITHVQSHENEQLRIKKMLLKLGNDLGGKRFLDVACRQGYGIKAAHLLGMKAYGIDQHSFFVDFAQSKYPPDMFKHITVQNYAATSPEKFDYIMAEHTFCEQVDIDGYVAALASLVKPGGIVYIKDIDGNHWNLPRSLSDVPQIDPPLSFIFPSKAGMEDLLARHNLRIQKMFFSWKPFLRIFAERIA